MEIRVSVIICAFNVEKYISRAIETVLQQSMEDLEVIIIDDASTDNTVKVIKSYLQDPRINLIQCNINRGPSYCRNQGINAAKGEWISILDSDDWMDKDRLTEMLGHATFHNADILADDFYIVNEGSDNPSTTHLKFSGSNVMQTDVISSIKFVETDIPGRRCLRLGMTKPIVKRSFLLKHNLRYDDNIRFTEDFHFYLRCLNKGAKFVLIPKPYYFYLKRNNSLTSQGKLSKLYKAREVNMKLLESNEIKANKKLINALLKRENVLVKEINFQRIVSQFHERRLFRILFEIISRPELLMYIVMRISRVGLYKVFRSFG